MFAPKKSTFLLLSLVALAATGCGKNEAPATADGIDAKPTACRSIAPAKLTHDTYMCALAEETQALADALATISDQASADRAIPSIRKSAARIAKIKAEASRLNKDPMAGGKGAVSARHLPQVAKANRAIIDETMRLTKERPDLWSSVGRAMDSK
jgi:hypothetical protein